MSYIGKSLGDGERIVGIARFHWLYSAKAWFVLLLPALVLVAAIARFRDTEQDWIILPALAFMALGLVGFLRRMIRKWTTEMGVTTHRFVLKTGLISLHTNEIALPNVESVHVNQGLGGRIFGYGRLSVEGTGIDAMTLPEIADPVGFRRAIETAKGAAN
jgi:uncharacterized membrane protein YdbT with pleckstrin-like domain